MDSATAAAPSPLTGGNARQKRVLPSRTRRGGPGVGGCDIDLLILETQKRKLENEPLIPADTPFLLTTNAAKYAEASSSVNLGLNTLAQESYFDRPEVLKAYREQQIIETPEYVNISDNPSVGGRFRPRGSEDIIDTSDAAYERRHRKYETFEKRQRLREKEKLKHEQYKLRERIEQLRSMEASAFLCLPPTSFPPRTPTSSSSSEEAAAATIAEGERRRKEMLDIALELEERYRMLLPPDRIKKYPGQPLTAATPSAASDATMLLAPDAELNGADEGEEALDEEADTEAVTRGVEKLTLRIRFNPRANGSTKTPTREERSPSRKTKPVPRAATSPSRVRRRKSKPSLAARSVVSEEPSPAEEAMSISAPPATKATRRRHSVPRPATPVEEDEEIAMPDVQPESYVRASHSPSPTSISDGDPPMGLYEHGGMPAPMESPPPRPRKRMKSAAVLSPQPQLRHELLRTPSVPPIESISAPVPRATSRLSTVHPPPRHITSVAVVGNSEGAACHLMVTSIRNNKARPTIRQITAFGVKVPLEISEPAEFEIPYWISNPEQDKEDTPSAEDLPVSRFTRGAQMESATAP